MKVNFNEVFDYDVLVFFDEIERQLNTNWVCIHYDVLKELEEFACFEKYEQVQQLNKDGSTTELFQAFYKTSEGESLCLNLERCKIGKNWCYFIIHSLKVNKKTIVPTFEPIDTIFYIN